MKKWLINLANKNAPRSLVLFIDLLTVIINYVLSYLILSNFTLDFDLGRLLTQIPCLFAISLIVFLLVGSYKGVIRHTGLRDTLSIYISVTLIAIVLLIISYFLDINSLYKSKSSIIIIHYLLSLIALVTSRFLFKFIYNALVVLPKEIKNILIFGAGEMGTILYSTLQKNSDSNTKIIAFIDDNINKKGKKIDRITINSIEKIDADFIKKNNISEVVIAVKDITQKRLLEISDQFLKLSVKIKMVPPISRWVDGQLEVNQIKEVKIEDLLNRNPISLDNETLKKEISNKTVLITGAAGSIGSEIVRQLSNYNYSKLILIDSAESPLYDVEQDLKRAEKENIIPIVSDVRDLHVMEIIFEKYKPDLVFHAAAYKHVPLMEANPYEAVKINIGGTKNIADLSKIHQVDKFVMVSTDKAVNPTNVMGATKRVAEMFVSSVDEISDHTKFIITRFGNVLGSNGSVIPLFRKQIAEGGPLTITHPDITRYFMTIPEATQLVLEAGAMGEGGEIFIFDMGKSVKIIDLAFRMIRLSGLKYPEDIDIKISGLRPGEKLYEELLSDDENTLPTYHKKIMISKVRYTEKQKVVDKVDLLLDTIRYNDTFKIVKQLKDIVPEYISNNSKFENLDQK